MPGEPNQEIPQVDRPTAILNDVIYDQNVVETLTRRPKEKKAVLDNISAKINELNPEETESMLKSVLDGLSKEDRIWTVDRRDVALEVLGVIPLDKIPKDQLMNRYIQAVNSQSSISDPNGSIYSLLEAGKVIAPSLPASDMRSFTTRISRLWEDIASHFPPEDRKFIQKTKDEAIKQFPFQIEETDLDPYKKRPLENSAGERSQSLNQLNRLFMMNI